MTEYKRQWRELSDEHKDKISQAMTDYWQTVPHRPDAESGHTTMKDLIGA